MRRPFTLATVTAARAQAMQVLTPTLHVEGKGYVAIVQQLAGISAAELGPAVGNVRDERAKIVAAFDLLITGI